MEKVKVKFRAWDGRKMFNVDVLAISPVVWDSGGTGVSLAYQPSVKVMQYTGLKDKNGKEIYEGDILGSPKNIDPRGIMKNIVIYQYEGFKHKWLNERTSNIRGRKIEPIFWNTHIVFEVIGNIYENPELLEGDSNV